MARKQELLLKKSSVLVAITAMADGPRRVFSPTQHKIFNALLFLASKQLEQCPGTVNFTGLLADVRKIINHRPGGKGKPLEDELKELSNIKFTGDLLHKWRSVNKNFDTHTWVNINLIASAFITGDSFTFEFPSEFRQLLVNPIPYAQLDLNEMIRLSSAALVLYEIGVDYRNVGGPAWLSIGTVRQLTGCANHYPHTADFVNRVLLPAVDDVNAKTSLRLTPTTRSTRKSITEVKLNVCSLAVDEVLTSAKVYAMVPQAESKKKAVTEMIRRDIDTNGLVVAASNIAYTLKQDYNSFGAYLQIVINKDLAADMRARDAANKNQRAKQQLATQCRVLRENRATEASAKATAKRQRREAGQFDALPAVLQNQIDEYLVLQLQLNGMTRADKLSAYFADEQSFERWREGRSNAAARVYEEYDFNTDGIEDLYADDDQTEVPDYGSLEPENCLDDGDIPISADVEVFHGPEDLFVGAAGAKRSYDMDFGSHTGFDLHDTY